MSHGEHDLQTGVLVPRVTYETLYEAAGCPEGFPLPSELPNASITNYLMNKEIRDLRTAYKGNPQNLKPRGYYLDRIERLADEVLPAVSAWRDGEYSVVFDHCFRRIAYDTACGMKWTEAIDRPFSRRAPVWLLAVTLDVLYEMVLSPKATHQYNDQSLQYRT